jgi:CDP-diacylglycerol--glycerol-3-phosphate 3-phosphatidyltransferase
MSKRDPRKLFPHDHVFRLFVNLFPSFIVPNHITMFRMALTPFVLTFLVVENYYIGIPLFLFAAFTDALDGSMARIRKKITAWGTFYDPVADKLLIGSVIVLIVVKHVNPVIAFGIIILEIMIITGGWYKRKKGEVGHANIWAKVKMFLETAAVTFLLIALASGMDMFIDLSQGTLVLAIIFAVVSLLTYSL